MAQGPQAPYWNPEIPKMRAQDIDRLVGYGIQNLNPETQRAFQMAGGVDQYRNLVNQYDRAYEDYLVKFYEHNYNQAMQSPHSVKSVYENQLANAYSRAASSPLMSEAEREQFAAKSQQALGASQMYREQEEAAKAQRELERQYREQAYSVRDPLRQSNVAFRDEQRQRLLQERDAGYKTIDELWNRDRAVIDDLFARKQITSSQRADMLRQAGADRSAARINIGQGYTARVGEIGGLYDQNRAFIDETVASLMQGGFDPTRQYALPEVDVSGIRLSPSYTPMFSSYAPVGTQETAKDLGAQAVEMRRAPGTDTPVESLSGLPTDTLKRLFEQSQRPSTVGPVAAETQSRRDLGGLPPSPYGQMAPDFSRGPTMGSAPSVFDPALRPVFDPVRQPIQGPIQGPQAGFGDQVMDFTQQFREGGEVSASKKDLDALPKFQAGGFVPLTRVLPSEKAFMDKRMAEYDTYNKMIDYYNAAVRGYERDYATYEDEFNKYKALEDEYNRQVNLYNQGDMQQPFTLKPPQFTARAPEFRAQEPQEPSYPVDQFEAYRNRAQKMAGYRAQGLEEALARGMLPEISRRFSKGVM
jgi:hypothetical protein